MENKRIFIFVVGVIFLRAGIASFYIKIFEPERWKGYGIFDYFWFFLEILIAYCLILYSINLDGNKNYKFCEKFLGEFFKEKFNRKNKDQ